MHDSSTLVSLAKATHASLLNLLVTLNHPRRIYCEDMQDVLVESLCNVIRTHAARMYAQITSLNHLEQSNYRTIKTDIYSIAVLTRTIVGNTTLGADHLISFVYGLCDIAGRIECNVEALDMEAIA